MIVLEKIKLYAFNKNWIEMRSYEKAKSKKENDSVTLIYKSTGQRRVITPEQVANSHEIVPGGWVHMDPTVYPAKNGNPPYNMFAWELVYKPEMINK